MSSTSPEAFEVLVDASADGWPALTSRRLSVTCSNLAQMKQYISTQLELGTEVFDVLAKDSEFGGAFVECRSLEQLKGTSHNLSSTGMMAGLHRARSRGAPTKVHIRLQRTYLLAAAAMQQQLRTGKDSSCGKDVAHGKDSSSQCSSDIQVLLRSAEALQQAASLTCRGADAAKRAMVDVGAVDVLLLMLSNYSDDARAVAAAAAALWPLARCSAARSRAATRCAVKLLLDALDAHVSDTRVVLTVACAVGNLCIDAANKSVLAAADGTVRVLDAARSYLERVASPGATGREDEPLQKLLFCLGNCCVKHKANAYSARSAGALDLCAKVLDTFVHNPVVASQAATTMYQVMERPTEHDTGSESGAGAAKGVLLEGHREVPAADTSGCGGASGVDVGIAAGYNKADQAQGGVNAEQSHTQTDGEAVATCAAVRCMSRFMLPLRADVVAPLSAVLVCVATKSNSLSMLISRQGGTRLALQGAAGDNDELTNIPATGRVKGGSDASGGGVSNSGGGSSMAVDHQATAKALARAKHPRLARAAETQATQRQRCRANCATLLSLLTGLHPIPRATRTAMVVVRARSTFALEMHVPAGGMLAFAFDVDGIYDIDFALRKGSVELAWDGQEQQRDRATGHYAQLGRVTGVWSALGPSDVTLAWDNTYSVLRSKTIRHSVRLFCER